MLIQCTHAHVHMHTHQHMHTCICTKYKNYEIMYQIKFNLISFSLPRTLANGEVLEDIFTSFNRYRVLPLTSDALSLANATALSHMRVKHAMQLNFPLAVVITPGMCELAHKFTHAPSYTYTYTNALCCL